MLKPLVILFFISGTVPTDEQQAEAAAMPAQVKFRNALHVDTDTPRDALEKCDGVAGDVPPLYAENFPTADDALAKRAEEVAAISARAGDRPAPKSGGGEAGGSATAATGGRRGKAAPAPAEAPQGQPQGQPQGPQAAGAPNATGGQTQPPAWNPNAGGAA